MGGALYVTSAVPHVLYENKRLSEPFYVLLLYISDFLLPILYPGCIWCVELTFHRISCSFSCNSGTVSDVCTQT